MAARRLAVLAARHERWVVSNLLAQVAQRAIGSADVFQFWRCRNGLIEAHVVLNLETCRLRGEARLQQMESGVKKEDNLPYIARLLQSRGARRVRIRFS